MKAAIAAALLLLAAPVLGLAVLAGSQGGAAGSGAAAEAAMLCSTTGPVPGLDATQAHHARTIVRVTRARVTGMDAATRAGAALIALMTAYTESTLHNYANPKVPASEHLPNDGDPPGGGDRDSVGLFQQRANWGPVADRMSPQTATQRFIARLVQVPDWAMIPPGVAAQIVQRSAHPNRYAAHEKAARLWLTQIQQRSHRPSSLSDCGRDRATSRHRHGRHVSSADGLTEVGAV